MKSVKRVDVALKSSEAPLSIELALRAAKRSLPTTAVAGEFDPDISYDAEFAGPMDALKEFGQRHSDKVNKQIYELVCGDTKESQQDRGKLRDAFGLRQSHLCRGEQGRIGSLLGRAAS